MNKLKLVVVGNGMAGIRAVEELFKLQADLYEITVIGDEPHPNYNRILLSPVLAGEQQLGDIVLNPLGWYSEHGIKLITGEKVVQIHRQQRWVKTDIGTTAHYDRLLLATGSKPFMLPVPGIDATGVISYRDIADTNAMIEATNQYSQAVVIGGGLLGLEAANGLSMRGMKVTVVHVMPWLLERQLDQHAADLLKASLVKRGLNFEMNAKTTQIVADATGRVSAVELSDGRQLPCQLVVMAVGIRPNVQLAQDAGLHIDRGIVVNDTMQTFDPRIYAVGECVSHRGQTYGLVAPLFDMSKVVANHLAQMGIARYTGSVTSTKLKVTGIDVFSAGQFTGGAECEEIILADPTAPNGGVYKKLVISNNRLVGACLYGDTVDGAWYFKLIRNQQPITEIRDRLMFGQSNLGDTGHQGQTQAVGMSDETEVCGCNGICKGAIVKAIKEKGLFTLDEVKKQTKASSSCGSCTGLVEQILMNTLGSDYSSAPKTKAICGCTDITHAQVRLAIKDERLTTISDVYTKLNWRTSNGCASCRPAINYYLLSTWPGQVIDDPQSRFINERSHANIQKDGTYSVIPRMWAGETNASELRRIADVADKYQVRTVKVTGGQRIDLLGIKKQDLPAVWRDLDMPSGHAYAKALRTVKTCVGSEWCRFGTQDSTQMGKDLEHQLFKMYAPHKVKLAVSGCPRNCAESGIKDVGIIGVDSGWELYIGGNGGIKTEVAQFFVKVKTAQEVLEYSGAFLQLYREEGWYLERTVHFIARVGMQYIRTAVLENAGARAALWERLQFALSKEVDPWHDPVNARVDTKQFAPLQLGQPLAEQPV
jgi:nitrite reductase (NADH) large subunit